MEIVKTTVQITVVDLKKLCKLKGLSIKRLAELANVNYANLNQAKLGKARLREETWEKIKVYLSSK